MFFIYWMLAGVFFFFTARAALRYPGEECEPVTIGTLLALSLFVWVWPLTALATIVWLCCGLADRRGGWLKKILGFKIIDTCKWFGGRK